MIKLSISIDMGAKNNGVCIVKSKDGQISDKKTFTIVVEKGKINFSKKSRRENRHKNRVYKRRKLTKRLLWETLDKNSFSNEQIEEINGLLNNRGYTFLSTSTEFEDINDETVGFISKYISELKDLKSKEDFETFLGEFENIDELKEFINEINSKITLETKKKKPEFYKEYQGSYKAIKKDLTKIEELFLAILNEIETGAKPRAKYLDDIKSEIQKFDFIKNKSEFFNLVGNISNLQLRVLRKYFNNKFDKKLDEKKLDSKIKRYFKAHHYKSQKEKEQREELFKELNKDILEFLKTCPSQLTIPPYEDMNNRDTYKCNSMLIKPELITKDIEDAIDTLLEDEKFSFLLTSNEGLLEKEAEYRVKPSKDNKYEKIDFTYSKYLQRILDATPEQTGKELNPRYVYKYDKPTKFIELFGKDIYLVLKDIAIKYYKEETKIHGGIYEESNSIFTKCNTNTPYKNNLKHILLKPIYSYNFTKQEAERFLELIENKKIDSRKGLKGALEDLSSEAKKHQNRFYSVVTSCFEDSKCIADKDIKKIVSNLPKMLKAVQEILQELNIKDSYLNTIEKLDSNNISRVINIFKQTYEILFKELSGFNKTCKHCTKENAIRSDEKNVIAKRLLSDVAKPIDGMLDMMLDRLAFEIVEEIRDEDIKDINSLEILLEQNRFEFEENLNDIKRANDPKIKKYKREDKNILNAPHCPYTGEKFDKGEYDHILPQSKEVYNSKANLIYVSPKGNKNKNANYYTLEDLNKEHLKDIFKTDNLDEIRKFISTNLETIEESNFKNFDALNIKQQIAMRYALFMRGTKEYDKAFKLVKMDKIKTITNGTQKRLARFIYEKLAKKYPDNLKNIDVSSKTIDNMLVSSTRSNLSNNQGELRKQKFQDTHSHCIDAMVVFYLANSKIKNLKSNTKETIIEPKYEFKDIYLKESGIKNVAKRVTFINSPKKELGSYKLFEDTIYQEHYCNIYVKSKENILEFYYFKEEKKEILEKIINLNNINILLEFKKILYISNKPKKCNRAEDRKYGKVYLNSFEYIENILKNYQQIVIKVDIKNLSDIIYSLFKEASNNRNKKENIEKLKKLKFLDDLRYFTSRKNIENIFFNSTGQSQNKKPTTLKKFVDIKDIPLESKKQYKSIYKEIEKRTELFEEGKIKVTKLNSFLQQLFESKQKDDNRKDRKRGRKRHIYSLPIKGSPKYRIKRGNTWQVLGNKDIATKWFYVDNKLISMPYSTQNVLPIAVNDLLTIVEFKDKINYFNNIVDIEIKKIETKYIKELHYKLTEAERLEVDVVLIKKYFKGIDFDKIMPLQYKQSENFKKFVDEFLNKKLNKSEMSLYKDIVELKKHIGGIRNDSKNASAILVEDTKEYFRIKYKASLSKDKKDLILKNL